MRLYIIQDKKEKIIAISEYKEYIFEFILQTNLKKKDISLYSTNDRILFDRLIIQHDELLLEEYDDTILLRSEVKIINNCMREEICRINSLIEDLTFVTKNYGIKDNKKSLFKKCIKELIKISKPKKLSKVTGLKNLLYELSHMNDKTYNEYFGDMYTLRCKGG